MGLIDAQQTSQHSPSDVARGPGLIDAARSIPTNRVKLTLELSNSLNQTLENMAYESGATKTEIIRKALALMEAASNAKNEGNQIGIVNPNGQLVTKIVGL